MNRLLKRAKEINRNFFNNVAWKVCGLGRRFKRVEK